MLSKIFTSFVSFFWIYYWVYAWTIEDSLLNIWEAKVTAANQENWFDMLAYISVWLKDSLTSFLVVIAIWVFLFIWIKLAMARWNSEEFHKAIKQLVYAVIWIFIVWFAWWAVVLISWLNL